MTEPERPLYSDDPIRGQIERAERALAKLYARRSNRFACECGPGAEWRWCQCGRQLMNVDKGAEPHCESC